MCLKTKPINYKQLAYHLSLYLALNNPQKLICHKKHKKHKQLCPVFELRLPTLFTMTVTVSPLKYSNHMTL